ncbi:MAG: hypothetical protein ACK56K_16155 [Akkermansiaceae bacterium]|jgi:hypothetical protein
MKFSIIIILLAGSVLSMGRQIERIWTDDQGRNTKAMLLRVENGNAILQLPNGKESPFPIAKLSKDDQLWIQNYSQEPAKGAPAEDNKLNFEDPWPEQVKFKGDPEIATAKEDKDTKQFVYESANYRYNCDVRLGASVVKGFAVLFETTHQFVRELPLSVNGGAKKDGKYEIFLFENANDYHSAGGPPGSAGVYIGGKNIVMVPLTSLGVKKAGTGYVMDREKSSKTLPHELVHQLTPHPYYAEGSMGWFTEGLAEYVAVTPYFSSGMFNVRGNAKSIVEYATAYGKDGTGGRGLGEKIKLGPLKNFMLQSYTSFTGNAQVNYGCGMLITNYFFHMDREKDGARIKKFLKALREGKQGEAALEVLLDGQTWLELEKDITKAYTSKGVKFTFTE